METIELHYAERLTLPAQVSFYADLSKRHRVVQIDQLPFLNCLRFREHRRRYEKGSILLTSNQSLGAWGEVFGDPVIATAILDRLLHHSSTINIKGQSYRLREKLKTELVKSKLAVEPGSDGTSAS